MKPAETQQYRVSLKNFNTLQLEKLLSNILREMRRRDSDHMKGDVVANSKSLGMIRAPE